MVLRHTLAYNSDKFGLLFLLVCFVFCVWPSFIGAVLAMIKVYPQRDNRSRCSKPLIKLLCAPTTGHSREVGRYSFHPVTLTLSGSSSANGQADALQSVQWPGIKNSH